MDVEKTPAPACTCPSGDGSMRWPCPIHAAVAAINLHEERIGFVLMPLSPAAVAPHVVEFIMGFDFDEVRDVYGERFAIFWQGLVGKFTAVAPALYITTDLAADFACRLAQYLAARQPGAQAPNFAACCAEGGGSISGCSCVNPNHVFLASQASLTAEERAHEETIDQRDRYHEVADELAGHIARITGTELGEHSSVNCPWQNAIEAAEGYTHAQGIDLGQQQDAARWRAIAPLLSVEWDEDEQLKRWTWIDLKGDAPAIPSPTRQEYASVDEAVDALISQRDAAPGVGE